MASRKKLVVMLVSGLTVLACSAISLYSISGKKSPVNESAPRNVKAQFPEKFTNRISVPAQGSNEERRTEYFASDRTTLQLREIVYKNGVTSIIHFRPNKKAERMEEFYPAQSHSSTRVLKTKVVFEDDGILFASHQSWRPDQTLVKEGFRQQDGSYRTNTYFADGVTIERVQNFTRKRDLTDETVYRADGVKARVTTVAPGGERKVTVYRPDKATEVTYMTMDIARSRYLGTKGKIFADDGKRVVANFESASIKTEINFLDENDKPLLGVRFERTVTGHLTVDTYVQNAQVKLSQVYLKRDASPHGCRGSYALNYVDEFAADNTNSGKRPFRRIYLAADEVTVKSVSVQDPNLDFMGRGTVYELYPSGFVAKKTVFSNHTTISSVTDYPDERYREPAAEVTDRSIFKRVDFLCPEPLPAWNQESRSWILE